MTTLNILIVSNDSGDTTTIEKLVAQAKRKVKICRIESEGEISHALAKTDLKSVLIFYQERYLGGTLRCYIKNVTIAHEKAGRLAVCKLVAEAKITDINPDHRLRRSRLAELGTKIEAMQQRVA